MSAADGSLDSKSVDSPVSDPCRSNHSFHNLTHRSPTPVSKALYHLWNAAGKQGIVYALPVHGDLEAWGDPTLLQHLNGSIASLGSSISALSLPMVSPEPSSDTQAIEGPATPVQDSHSSPLLSRLIIGTEGQVLGQIGVICFSSSWPSSMPAILDLAADALAQTWNRVSAENDPAPNATSTTASTPDASPLQIRIPGVPNHFTAVIDTGSAFAFIKDEAGRYVYVNQRVRQAFPDVLEGWLGKTDAELALQPDADVIRTHDLEVLQLGGIHQFEEKVSSPAGPRFFRSFKWLMLANDGGKFVAGTATELTSDYQVRAERDGALATLDGLFSASPLGIAVFDPSHCCCTANQAFVKLLRLDRQSILGRSFQSLLPNLTEELRQLPHTTQLERQTQRGRFFIPASSREFHEWELIWFPILDSQNNVNALGLIIEDVTDRGLNERRLERQANRDQLLAETAELMLRSETLESLLAHLFDRLSIHFEMDLLVSHCYDESNQSLRLVASQGLTSQNRHRLSLVKQDEGIWQTLLNTRRSISALLDASDSESATHWMMEPGVRYVIALPLLVGDKLMGTLTFGSRRRQSLSEEDRRLLECLADLVAATFQRLQLIERLREADRGKANLLATLAHELRNPLSPLRTGIELLTSSAESETSRATLSIMRHQIDHIVQLIDDLLDMSRISTGKLTLRLKPIDLRDVIERAVESVLTEFESAHQTLNLSVPSTAVVVLGDQTRLVQTVSNLLHNASKFTPDRGTIELHLKVLDDHAVITIRDNGVGIAREYLPYIFEAFAHGDSLLSRTDGGLGIGLAIVKGIVEGHSGTVDAKSSGLGRGSTFSIKLPCHLQSIETHPQASNSGIEISQASRKEIQRILVVDDNRPAANTIAELLRFCGHEVQVAFDGSEGLKAVERFQPGVVLLDIGMPNMNGYQVARQIRRQTLGRGIRLIALTGWGQAEDRAQAMAAGFDHHLTKPVKAETLIDLLTKTATLPGLH